MTDCKSDYAGLAQYNNGIAFKPWNRPHTYNRANPPVLSTLKNNVYGRMNTSGYHTLKDGYVSYPTNCTNVIIPSLSPPTPGPTTGPTPTHLIPGTAGGACRTAVPQCYPGLGLKCQNNTCVRPFITGVPTPPIHLCVKKNDKCGINNTTCCDPLMECRDAGQRLPGGGGLLGVKRCLPRQPIHFYTPSPTHLIPGTAGGAM